MAAPRRRYPNKSTTKSIDESSNISTKEEEQVVEELFVEEVTEIKNEEPAPEPAPVVKEPVIQEIVPVADPGPRFIEVVEPPAPKKEVKVGESLVDKTKQKKHPRNTPRFSRAN